MMPKPKRPRSKPDVVDRLYDAIKDLLTAERASRFYAVQWVMLHSVARHLGITDEEADRAVVLALERRRIKAAGSPPHR
jgi:predicted Zn-dependent protease with MMP-like domain